jgi:hypothetical protein
MDPEGSSVGGILRSVGVNSMGLEKIKFGIGVVGKMTTGLIAVLSVLAVLGALGLICGQFLLSYICLAAIIFFFLFNHVSVMWFSSKHPAVAILEGAELVRYHQVEMAAKGLSLPTTQPNVEPPLIEAVEANDENVQLEHKVGS